MRHTKPNFILNEAESKIYSIEYTSDVCTHVNSAQRTYHTYVLNQKAKCNLAKTGIAVVDKS